MKIFLAKEEIAQALEKVSSEKLQKQVKFERFHVSMDRKDVRAEMSITEVS